MAESKIKGDQIIADPPLASREEARKITKKGKRRKGRDVFEKESISYRDFTVLFPSHEKMRSTALGLRANARC